MRNDLFRFRKKSVPMNAAAVQVQAHTMVRQMALPLITERRVKGALDAVSRETGLTFSKVRKIYYRLTENILHYEFRNIAEAYKRYVINQERAYRMEAERLQQLIAANEQWEAQHGMDFTPGHCMVAETSGEAVDAERVEEAGTPPTGNTRITRA